MKTAHTTGWLSYCDTKWNIKRTLCVIPLTYHSTTSSSHLCWQKSGEMLPAEVRGGGQWAEVGWGGFWRGFSRLASCPAGCWLHEHIHFMKIPWAEQVTCICFYICYILIIKVFKTEGIVTPLYTQTSLIPANLDAYPLPNMVSFASPIWLRPFPKWKSPTLQLCL